MATDEGLQWYQVLKGAVTVNTVQMSKMPSVGIPTLLALLSINCLETCLPPTHHQAPSLFLVPIFARLGTSLSQSVHLLKDLRASIQHVLHSVLPVLGCRLRGGAACSEAWHRGLSVRLEWPELGSPALQWPQAPQCECPAAFFLSDPSHQVVA